jgi:hypothetical protein
MPPPHHYGSLSIHADVVRLRLMMMSSVLKSALMIHPLKVSRGIRWKSEVSTLSSLVPPRTRRPKLRVQLHVEEPLYPEVEITKKKNPKASL